MLGHKKPNERAIIVKLATGLTFELYLNVGYIGMTFEALLEHPSLTQFQALPL